MSLVSADTAKACPKTVGRHLHNNVCERLHTQAGAWILLRSAVVPASGVSNRLTLQHRMKPKRTLEQARGAPEGGFKEGEGSGQRDADDADDQDAIHD